MLRDFTPLGSAADFPADPDGVRDYGQDLEDTGRLIEEQVAQLKGLADRDSWTADTADAFRDRAESLAEKIERARGRYLQVGAKLKVVADDLDDHERDAALTAGSARVHAAVLRSTPQAGPEAQPDGGPPVMTPEGTAQNRRRAEAQAEYDRLQREYDRTVEAARETAEHAAGAIRGVLDDAVQDDFWDRNAGWLKVARVVLGVVAAIAGVLLLVVTAPVWATALLVVALVAGVLALVISIGMLAKADGSWTDVALDAVGVVTLGVGGVALRALAKGFPAVRAATASVRGSNAFQSSMNRFWGVPLRFHSWRASWPLDLMGLRSASIASIVRMSDEALDAANAAHRATLAPFPVTRLQRFVDGGLANAQTVRQAREILATLPHLDDVPVALLDDVTRLVKFANTGVVLTNVGAVTDIVSTGYQLPAFDGVNGIKIVTDLLGRLR